MKNLIIAFCMLFGFTTINAQAVKKVDPVIKASSNPASPKTQTKVVTLKPTSAATPKTVTSPAGVPLKKDGTIDKRFKQSKGLKKDGTPDKRFKKNA